MKRTPRRWFSLLVLLVLGLLANLFPSVHRAWARWLRRSLVGRPEIRRLVGRVA